MNLTFIYAPGFVREWSRLRINDEDLIALEQLIGRSPHSAPVIRGTGGLRKIRFAPPSMHRGKSGATRVGFGFFQSKSAVIVIAIFAKNDAENFTADERNEIAGLLAAFERNFK